MSSQKPSKIERQNNDIVELDFDKKRVYQAKQFLVSISNTSQKHEHPIDLSDSSSSYEKRAKSLETFQNNSHKKKKKKQDRYKEIVKSMKMNNSSEILSAENHVMRKFLSKKKQNQRDTINIVSQKASKYRQPQRMKQRDIQPSATSMPTDIQAREHKILEQLHHAKAQKN